MLDITINGKELAIGLTLLAGLVVVAIMIMRRYLVHKSENLLTKEIVHPAARNKRPEVDVLRWSATVLRGGMAVALAMTVLAFSWTSYEEKIYIPDGAEGYIDDFMEVIPPTSDPKPPPPPPPIPIVEPVPDIELEKDPEFADMSIDANDEVLDKKPIIKDERPAPPVIAPPAPVVDAPPLKFAEQMPRFLSNKCEGAATKEEVTQCAQGEMLKFIYKHIRYPAIAEENGIEGTTVIRFVVSKNGDIEQAEILRNIGGGCGEEALKIVKSMPKWKAGRQGGRKVPVYFNLPVKFKLK